MALRKAASYSKKRVVPYTRKSKKRNKSYVKTVPNQKIAKFNMGNRDESRFPYKMALISDEKIQVRNQAIEASRQHMNKELAKNLSDQYNFKVIPYPHHIQRENKMLTGAGADRMQTGMREAYGKPSSSAAILKKGSKIFVISVKNRKNARYVRNLLKQIKPKLPGKTRIRLQIKESN